MIIQENKQRICDLLCATLKETRNFWNLTELEYDQKREKVVCHFQSGWTVEVDVFADSGTAMIKDIMRKLQ